MEINLILLKKHALLILGSIVLMSCGKNADRSISSTDIKLSEEFTSNILVLNVSNTEPVYQYTAHNNQIIYLPESLEILAGDPNHREVYLFFNIDSGGPKFFCTYQAEESSYEFVDCYDDLSFGGSYLPLSMSPGDPIVQGKGKQFSFELENSDPSNLLQLRITMDIEEQ